MAKVKLPRELRRKKLNKEQMHKYYPDRYCPSCDSFCCHALHLKAYGIGGSNDDNQKSKSKKFFGSTAGAVWTIGAGVVAAAAIFIYQNGINAENMEDFLKEQAAEKAAEAAVETISQNDIIDPSETSPEPEGLPESAFGETRVASVPMTDDELNRELFKSMVEGQRFNFQKLNPTDADLGIGKQKVDGEPLLPPLEPPIRSAKGIAKRYAEIKKIKAQIPEWKIAQTNGTAFPASEDISGEYLVGNYLESTTGESGTTGQVRGKVEPYRQDRPRTIDDVQEELRGAGIDAQLLETLDDEPRPSTPITKTIMGIVLSAFLFGCCLFVLPKRRNNA